MTSSPLPRRLLLSLLALFLAWNVSRSSAEAKGPQPKPAITIDAEIRLTNWYMGGNETGAWVGTFVMSGTYETSGDVYLVGWETWPDGTFREVYEFAGDRITFQSALPAEPENSVRYDIEVAGTVDGGQAIYALGTANGRTRWITYQIRDPLWWGKAKDMWAFWKLEAFLQ